MNTDKSIVTENEIIYVLHGDYYLPLIEVPKPARPIGKYGRMRLNYLKEHRPMRYNSLIPILSSVFFSVSLSCFRML